MKKDVYNLFYLLRFLWRLNKAYFFVALPQIVLFSVQPFILIIFPKLIIDEITSDGDINRLLYIVVIMGVCSLVSNLLQYLLQAAVTVSYNKISFQITSELGKKVMSLKYQDIENPEILDIFNKVQRTLNLGGLFEALTSIISNLIRMTALIAIIASLSYIVCFVIIFVVIINVICESAVKKYDYQWQQEATPFQRRFNYFASLMYDFKYGKEIRLNNLAGLFKDKYDNEVNVYGSKLRKVIFKFLRVNSVHGSVGAFQEFFMYAYLAIKAFNKSISIGDFTMYVASINNFTYSLNNVISSLLELRQQSRFINDFIMFMELESMSDSGNKKLSDLNVNNGIIFEFENVSFKYPYSDQYVLKNISLVINDKEKLSIVGVNGAGKTTLIKLLMRLYTPTGGRILLNGVDINKIRFSEYISLFSVVFQDYQLFAFSVEDNITLSCQYDKKRLSEAILKSGLTQKINSLPKNLKTELYKIFDTSGIEFSGGESQKLAIARAIYRDSIFFILDEPTAALDPLAEYEIYSHFNTMVENKSSVFIS